MRCLNIDTQSHSFIPEIITGGPVENTVFERVLQKAVFNEIMDIIITGTGHDALVPGMYLFFGEIFKGFFIIAAGAQRFKIFAGYINKMVDTCA